MDEARSAARRVLRESTLTAVDDGKRSVEISPGALLRILDEADEAERASSSRSRLHDQFHGMMTDAAIITEGHRRQVLEGRVASLRRRVEDIRDEMAASHPIQSDPALKIWPSRLDTALQADEEEWGDV